MELPLNPQRGLVFCIKTPLGLSLRALRMTVAFSVQWIEYIVAKCTSISPSLQKVMPLRENPSGGLFVY
jgi:hypothetical protein